MKKVSFIVAALLAGSSLHAQERHYSIDHGVFNTVSIIFLIGMCMVFILAFMKRMFDYKLKNRIVDKGIPEHLASSLLETNPEENKHINLKWFALLAGAGIGLIIVYYTQPLDIHSLAIMSLSIAFGFLGYFIYLKKSGS